MRCQRWVSQKYSGIENYKSQTTSDFDNISTDVNDFNTDYKRLYDIGNVDIKKVLKSYLEMCCSDNIHITTSYATVSKVYTKALLLEECKLWPDKTKCKIEPVNYQNPEWISKGTILFDEIIELGTKIFSSAEILDESEILEIDNKFIKYLLKKNGS